MTIKGDSEKQYLDNFNNKYRQMGEGVKPEVREREAQKYSIRKSFDNLIGINSGSCASEIWKALQSSHIKRKSGAELTSEQIGQVISAQQSWNKSSGHAFEEFLPQYFNDELNKNGLSLCLQRDISSFMAEGRISNSERDKVLIRSWIDESVFDLYMVIVDENSCYVFGTVQAKTSIRDRVTRDREPAIQAMNHFFWAVALVLDGEFLKLPKFQSMVNGGSDNYPENGWHGMYVFSDIESNERIASHNVFIDHCISAKNSWLSERQWMDLKWKPGV